MGGGAVWTLSAPPARCPIQSSGSRRQQSLRRRMLRCCLQSRSCRQSSHGCFCCNIFTFHLSYGQTAHGGTAAQRKVVPGWTHYICCHQQPFATQTANCPNETKPLHECFEKQTSPSPCGRPTLTMSRACSSPRRPSCCGAFLCLDGAQNGFIDRCGVEVKLETLISHALMETNSMLLISSSKEGNAGLGRWWVQAKR